MKRFSMTARTAVFAAVFMVVGAGSALAYDGTNCKEAGSCWEPKPGYPEKVEGSQYDPQHDPMELNKQAESITGMEERNAKRSAYLVKTGTFIYDVAKIPAE